MVKSKKWFGSAQKLLRNGIEYASRGEAEFSAILDKLLLEKTIISWSPHPVFKLKNYKKQSVMKYTPDFLVTFPNGRKVCVEIKSGGKFAITEAANVRMAYFVFAYPDIPLVLIRSSGKDKFNLSELLFYSNSLI